MTTSQEVSSSEHKIDALTSDFFRAVSFFAGNKPAYQNLYKLFIESGQLIKNSAIFSRNIQRPSIYRTSPTHG